MTGTCVANVEDIVSTMAPAHFVDTLIQSWIMQ